MDQEPSTILLVDTDAESLFPLSGFIQELGYRSVTATGVQQALSIAIRERLDLLVTASKLGQVTGIELCERLRTIRRHSRLPALFLNENQAANVALRTRRGVPEYSLGKPVITTGLAALLDCSIDFGRRYRPVPIPAPQTRFGQHLKIFPQLAVTERDMTPSTS